MRIYLDANILVAVLNKEYPTFSSAARVLSLNGESGFQLYTSSVCLAITFYFTAKKYGSGEAKKKIALLINHIKITSCGEKEIIAAAANKKVKDFEDGIQYYSAINESCNCIVTEDKKNFHFSKIEVHNSTDFLKKYVVGKR